MGETHQQQKWVFRVFIIIPKRLKKMNKTKIIELAVKVLVAALTAFLTALTTTSCMGYGPF